MYFTPIILLCCDLIPFSSFPCQSMDDLEECFLHSKYVVVLQMAFCFTFLLQSLVDRVYALCDLSSYNFTKFCIAPESSYLNVPCHVKRMCFPLFLCCSINVNQVTWVVLFIFSIPLLIFLLTQSLWVIEKEHFNLHTQLWFHLFCLSALSVVISHNYKLGYGAYLFRIIMFFNKLFLCIIFILYTLSSVIFLSWVVTCFPNNIMINIWRFYNFSFSCFQPIVLCLKCISCRQHTVEVGVVSFFIHSDNFCFFSGGFISFTYSL